MTLRYGHLALLSFSLAALFMVACLSACSSECLTDCGLRSDTADCTELQRAETATVRGYAEVNAETCPYLRGWQVVQREATMTSSDGRPCWHDERAPDFACVYGYTDCQRHGIEVSYLGILPHEVGHVLDSCMTTHEEMAQRYGAAEHNASALILTGSAGGTP